MHSETYGSPSILVAMPQLQDPNFWHAVLILIEHTEDGAMGFIVNKPSEIPVKALLKEQNELDIPVSIPAWTGGPVAGDNGLILTNKTFPGLMEEDIITEGLHLTSSPAALEGLIKFGKSYEKGESNKDEALYPYRFVVGYAGWGPGQLEDEVKEGSWIQVPYIPELIFETPWAKMWEVAVASLGVTPESLAAPQQPSYLN